MSLRVNILLPSPVFQPYIEYYKHVQRFNTGTFKIIPSLVNICNNFSVSPRTLQRRFKEEIGMPPKEFMQITRLNHALELLHLGEYESLSDLSYLSGYYDQAHFINDIRKMCGSSPGNINKKVGCLRNVITEFLHELIISRLSPFYNFLTMAVIIFGTIKINPDGK